MSERARIVFVTWTAPDGQVVGVPDDVLAEDESISFDNGWVHVSTYDFGTVPRRSYPAHVISSVQFRSPAVSVGGLGHGTAGQEEQDLGGGAAACSKGEEA